MSVIIMSFNRSIPLSIRMPSCKSNSSVCENKKMNLSQKFLNYKLTIKNSQTHSSNILKEKAWSRICRLFRPSNPTLKFLRRSFNVHGKVNQVAIWNELKAIWVIWPKLWSKVDQQITPRTKVWLLSNWRRLWKRYTILSWNSTKRIFKANWPVRPWTNTYSPISIKNTD